MAPGGASARARRWDDLATQARPDLEGLVWVKLGARLALDTPVQGVPPHGWGALVRAVFGRNLFALDPAAAAGLMGDGRSDDAVRPWWLSVQALTAPSSGDAAVVGLDVAWHLAGPALAWQPAVEAALMQLGVHGFGRQRITARLGPEGIDVARFSADAVWNEGLARQAADQEGPLALQALSPWRLRHRNEAVMGPMPLDVLLLACMNRLAGLRRACAGQTTGAGLGLPARRAWLDGAAALAPLAAVRDIVQAPRWSARQARRLPLAGWVGAWQYAAPSRAALPWLALAEHLQLGSKTTLGFGRLRVTTG